MFEYNLKHYAHLGDAIWELFVRELCVVHTQKPVFMHKLTTKFVCASYQAKVIALIEELLNEEEKETVRRGRNLKMTINKKNNPQIHCAATSFEVLLGYLHINNRQRLNEILEIIKKTLNETLDTEQ